jgi:D-lactate dehydrogenase (cytochrome)
MRLPNGSLSEMLEIYRRGLQAAGLKAAIFGHAADTHLHVNILPQDGKQFDEGRTLIEIWAKKISAMGGNIVAEHGVGKIKKYLFRSIPLPERLRVIRSLKQQLDPNGLWNPGNMLDSY